jgi:Zn-dependent M28 family amino/carboxypeptidase
MKRLPNMPATRLKAFFLLILAFCGATAAQAQTSKTNGKVSGVAVYALTKQFLAVAPKRFNGSPGHAAAEQFIKDHFAPEIADHRFDVDHFTASTPVGFQPMNNIIVRYPGKKDGIIVLLTHYETNYPLKDVNFVGANDGACTTALLIAIGEYLRKNPPQGYSVYLVFDDGEEAVANPPYDPAQWGDGSHALYGTRHLAAKWSQDGTIGHIKALLLADMIGDKDLNILEETQSTKSLRDLLRQAAVNTGHSAYVFKTSASEEDDHLPFLQRGVPSIDIIDVDYGPKTNALPDGYHHTVQDTIDKVSPRSLQISADLFLEMITLINQH